MKKIENLFKDLPNVSESDKNEQFKLLQNEPSLISERKIVESWVEDYDDMDGNFKRDFQKNFRPQLWELYLHTLFKKAKFKRVKEYSAPDFIFDSPCEFCVEATTANFSYNNQDSVQRTTQSFDNLTKPPYMINLYEDSLNSSIVRIGKKIRDKKSAYNKYLHNGAIKDTTPYIIAIGAYDKLDSGNEFIYPMLALLYGWYYEASKDQFITLNSVVDIDSNREQMLNLFALEDYKNVSAIIFSSTITLGKLTALAISEGMYTPNCVYSFHEVPTEKEGIYKYQLKDVSVENPEELEEGVFVFHNPNAKNPLDSTVFSSLHITQYFYEDDTIKYSNNISPLIVRKSIPKILQNVEKFQIMEDLRAYNKLSFNEFYE